MSTIKVRNYMMIGGGDLSTPIHDMEATKATFEEISLAYELLCNQLFVDRVLALCPSDHDDWFMVDIIFRTYRDEEEQAVLSAALVCAKYLLDGSSESEERFSVTIYPATLNVEIWDISNKGDEA